MSSSAAPAKVTSQCEHRSFPLLPFNMACTLIANRGQRDGLRLVLLNGSACRKRSLVVSIPIRMDNGETHCFPGYRVQHCLTSGFQRRAARRPFSGSRRGRGPFHVDVLECGIMNFAILRRQGRRRTAIPRK